MMGFIGLESALRLVEQGRVPDALVRAGIRNLVSSGLRERRRRGVAAEQAELLRLLAELRVSPIAIATDAANAQHYELPERFFGLCLGPRRKYSGCFYPPGVTTLAEAEVASLRATAATAELADGQNILELGCGWGALTLWMAEHFPNARITAVSNSHGQRTYLEQQAAARGFDHVRVITADMNDLALEERFDRVVSVEMFEHMRNYAALMRRIAGWLKPDGKLFVHIFVHGRTAYYFETSGAADWMGKHFFTGGIMPSDHLLTYFQDDLVLEHHSRQDGTHYARTANHWLANLDANLPAVRQLMSETYGREAPTWLQRWRVFYLACAEMFGYAGGQEWWVAHYRFRPRTSPRS